MKSDKMRKDLQAAHDLAAAQHPLSHYKELLHQFQEDLIEQEKNKAAKAATPKSKKAKATDDEADDLEMADAGDEDDEPKDKKAKKRKAEDSAEVCSKVPFCKWAAFANNQRHRNGQILSKSPRSN